MDKAGETLLRAADLVDQGWTQNMWAVDEHGTPTRLGSPEAEAWCADGAIRRASLEIGKNTLERDTLYSECSQRLRKKIGLAGEDDGNLTWNDVEGRTQEEVSCALRDAAELPGILTHA